MLQRKDVQVGTKVVLSDKTVVEVLEVRDLPKVNADAFCFRWVHPTKGTDYWTYVQCPAGYVKNPEPTCVVGVVRETVPEKSNFFGGSMWVVTDDRYVVELDEYDNRFLRGVYKGLRRAWHWTGTACSKAVSRILGWVEWLVGPPDFVSAIG